MRSPVLHNIALLSNAECDSVHQAVKALRPHWTHRHPVLPVYALGAASYLDVVGDEPPYAQRARDGNRLLRLHFAWLYERVAAALAQALGEPACYVERLALPGFHIYLFDKAFEQPIAPIHFDLQYRFHDWSATDADLDHPISFTLPIALPQHGGGLNTWDISLAERRQRASETPQELAQSCPRIFHAYQRGHMALHSGHLLHQIAPGTDLQPQDERITLQGHGLYAQGMWRLYW